jgi:NADH dehydrogenase FAD-containing subunit
VSSTTTATSASPSCAVGVGVPVDTASCAGGRRLARVSLITDNLKFLITKLIYRCIYGKDNRSTAPYGNCISKVSCPYAVARRTGTARLQCYLVTQVNVNDRTVDSHRTKETQSYNYDNQVPIDSILIPCPSAHTFIQ